jgi:hypothetical protein
MEGVKAELGSFLGDIGGVERAEGEAPVLAAKRGLDGAQHGVHFNTEVEGRV